MDLKYSESQEALRKLVRDFAEKEVAPGAAERDRTETFDPALYRKLGELGISGMLYPEEYGGTGSDFLSWCLALEELGRVDLSLAATLMVGAAVPRQLVDLGTPEQIEKWKEPIIQPIVRAEATGAGAITEPGAGSDTSGIQTTAVLDGDEWVINGNKTFISNAGLDINICVIVLCVTDRAKREFSNILVPTGTPGYQWRKISKMGARSQSLCEVFFDDCRVPADNLVGQRGIGRRFTVDRGFVEGRIGVGSISLGVAEACLEQSLRYAKERVAFKRPISQFQFVQAMLVDMALEAELSRLLRDKAATALDEGQVDRKLSSMVKYFCCESAKRATDYAVQIHGGLGFCDECPASRYYRDIRMNTIADGTTEIQKWIVARELGC